MSDTLTFFTHPMSRARIARWMLEETGLPYETVILDYNASMKAPDYLDVNPLGKVPALKHGDTVITENVAVCMYLADLVPDKRLAPPPGSLERGTYYRWLLFAAGPLEALLTAKQTGHVAAPSNAGYGSEADMLQTLEQAVEGRQHLVGEHFTTADLVVAAFLAFYMRIGLIAPRPAFTAFAERHCARTAALRANAIDDALVPAHPHPRMKS